jgi:hypothetical protein
MDPTLNVRVLADTAGLGGGLMQAETMVRQTTGRIGRQVDGVMTTLGQQITGKLKAAFGLGMAVSVVDTALRSVAQAIRNDTSIADALSTGIMDGIKRLPIVGAIVEAAEPAAESFGETFARAWIETYGDPGNIIYSDRTNAIFEEQAQRIRQSLETELESLQASQAEQVDPLGRTIATMRAAEIGEADTALGSFRFGIGGSAADISRDLSGRAEEQVTVLRRIEEIQKELRDSLKGSN